MREELSQTPPEDPERGDELTDELSDELSDELDDELDDELSEDPSFDTPGEGEDERSRAHPRLRRWVKRNSWLLLAAGAALVLTRVVEFEAPSEVRIDDTTVDFVGEAPSQEFSSQLGNPQAVQLRATLRLYPRNDLDVSEPDPKLDAAAQILSQPVVTTIYAMNAEIDQSVRLGSGKLQIDVALAGTPRLDHAGKSEVPRLDLEHELTVTSTETRWLGEPVRSLRLHTRGSLTDLEDRPYRWVFVIEGKLFALDLELNRAI